MKKEKKQKCRASIARLSVSEPNRERKLKNKNLEREKARRDFIRQIETKKDAGYRRGCLSLNKGKSPERDLSPGTCLVRMFITDLIKKVYTHFRRLIPSCAIHFLIISRIDKTKVNISLI